MSAVLGLITRPALVLYFVLVRCSRDGCSNSISQCMSHDTPSVGTPAKTSGSKKSSKPSLKCKDSSGKLNPVEYILFLATYVTKARNINLVKFKI
ncbi:hypothetical protein BYT27DRAFT_7197216, partial [Phlegmacium glaucopus]